MTEEEALKTARAVICEASGVVGFDGAIDNFDPEKCAQLFAKELIDAYEIGREKGAEENY